jgi:hypothetical protein
VLAAAFWVESPHWSRIRHVGGGRLREARSSTALADFARRFRWYCEDSGRFLLVLGGRLSGAALAVVPKSDDLSVADVPHRAVLIA